MRVRCFVWFIRSLVVSLRAGSFTPTLSIRHPHEPPGNGRLKRQPVVCLLAMGFGHRIPPCARTISHIELCSYIKNGWLGMTGGRGERHRQTTARPDDRVAVRSGLGDASRSAEGSWQGLTRLIRRAAARRNRLVSVAPQDDLEPSPEGTRYTLAYGRYRLAYEVYGSGDRVLVWLHGLLLDANLSRGLARALAAQGNRVVLLDFLGHGRSDKPRHAGAHRMDLYAEQVLCLLDELGVDQVVLGGVSMGTNVSLMATVAAPERVRGLILEMPVLEWAAPAAALVFLPLLLECPLRPSPTAIGLQGSLPPASFRVRSARLVHHCCHIGPGRNRRRAAWSPAGAHRPDLRPAPGHHCPGAGPGTRDRPDPLIQ